MSAILKPNQYWVLKRVGRDVQYAHLPHPHSMDLNSMKVTSNIASATFYGSEQAARDDLGNEKLWTTAEIRKEFYLVLVEMVEVRGR